MVKRNFVSWINTPVYNKITELVPIACVDLLITKKNKFLLGKRVNAPAKNEWFVPGGRIYKGESLEKTVYRKAKEELGISLKKSQISFLTTGETIFQGKTIDDNRHTVNNVFKIDLDYVPKFIYDKKQISKLQWFTKIDRKWHPYVKETLKIANFK